MNVRTPDEAARCIVASGDHVAVVGDNRKMVVFPLAEVPALLAHDEPPDALTADASLVALSALIRLGAIDADDPLFPWLADLCGLGR